MWRTVQLGLLIVLCIASIGLSKTTKKKKNKQWKDYRRFWCTDFGRQLITRGVTAEKCQSFCGDGCEAVEWWETGKNACYLCKDLKYLTEFPKQLRNDQSFPPHVFIKRMPGKFLPKKVDLMTTTSRPFTTTKPIDENPTTSLYNEGTTILPKPEHTTVEAPATHPSNSPYTKTSSLTEDRTTSSSKEEPTITSLGKEGTTESPNEEGTTTSLEKGGTTASPEDVKITTSPEDEETIASPEDERTTTLPKGEEKPTSSGEDETTTFPQEEVTSTSPEEGTTAQPEDEETTTSPEEEGTTTLPEVKETTASSEVKEATTSPEEGGITTSPKGVEKTTSPEEQTCTQTEEEETTTSPEEGTTIQFEVEETTTSPEVEEASTSPVVGTTTQTEDEETTTSPEVEEASTSPVVGTTTQTEDEETTTSPEEEEATTSPEEGTTTPPEGEEATTSPVEGTTTQPEDEETTTSPEEGGTTTISPKGKEAATSPEEEGATTSLEDVETTSLSSEEETTTSPEEEGRTTLPKEEETTSSPVEKVTSSAPTSPSAVTAVPDVPRNVKAKAVSETEIEVTWDPPTKAGARILFYEARVTEVTEEYAVVEEKLIQMPGANLSFVIESLRPETQYVIMVSAGNDYGISAWSGVIYSETPKAIKARIEPTDFPGKNNATKTAEGMPPCVKVEKDDNTYTVNASYGRWPDDGFCRTLVDSNASKHEAYIVSADLYVPEVEGATDAVYLGVFFNAEDENNFDFISFRFGSRDGSCFQTGTVRNGRISWYGSQAGSCPFGPPPNRRWARTAVEIRGSDVTVFLDDAYVVSFKARLFPKAAGGVAVANHHGNVIRFKDFSITDLPSLPFRAKSCASVQDHNEYYSVISQNDHWFQGFCRALAKNTLNEDDKNYQISVDLFSEVDWSGDRLAYLGIIFNARDINNADFIYFRPFWKDYCYQTGYLLAGYQMRDSSKTGPCSCAVKGGKWFNVRLEIRRNAVTVIMNGIPTTTFTSHYSAVSKGSGILVTGGRRMAIRFRNLVISRLPQLPFVSKSCQNTRVARDGFKLMAYSGLEDSEKLGICRAVFPKTIVANSYVISVKIRAHGSLIGGKYGIIFNVKNADSFEFVYFRPYYPRSCVEAGHVKASKMKGYSTIKSLSCTYGILKSGHWYNVRVKVSGNSVKVLVDDVEVAGFKSHFEVNGRGGVMVASGFKRKISFKDYRIFN